MSVSAYGSIRVPRVGSTSSAPLEHGWYIGGMEVGFPPARGGQASSSEGLHARGTFAEPSSTQARMLYRVAASPAVSCRTRKSEDGKTSNAK